MDRRRKNILITGGGTGGHLYPAIAVIEYIQKNHPLANIIFIGSGKGSGKKLIPDMGIEFYTVKARGIAGGSGPLKKIINYILFIIYLIPGFIRSANILRKKKIDIVLGMGGYICAPVMLAAIIRKIPFTLHEQNYIPGRLNRLFSGRAKYFFTSFEDTKRFLGKGNKNIIFSGNPVRASIKDSDNIPSDHKKWGLAEKRFTIIAFGGSLGAKKINDAIMGLYKIFKDNNNIQFLLITGNRFYDSIKDDLEKRRRSDDKIIFNIFPYIDEISQIYRIADIVIARSGASTVFETAAADIPTILVPYPFAIDNHQFYNARYLAEQGKSIIIEDNMLSAGLLAENIKRIMEDNMKIYKKMKNILPAIPLMDSQQIISDKLMEDHIG
ncbi:MAG TPA: undecaprenyldiphospho-muramoylpentapeptide beta-N-acetylglucosaminyltransferase [Actinobacteria bacterium]|nr:undecaprenyldiphospho-muramoylpentapeptide beta-N-acetylglucosaminyltransferase [Actinomycetota bacterium]